MKGRPVTQEHAVGAEGAPQESDAKRTLREPRGKSLKSSEPEPQQQRPGLKADRGLGDGFVLPRV